MKFLLKRLLTLVLLFVTIPAMAAPCFNFAEWVNACVDRVQKSEALLKTNVVDVRFPGKNAPPASDRWVVENYKELVDLDSPWVFDKNKILQNDCTSIQAGKTTTVISAYGRDYLDLIFDPSSKTSIESNNGSITYLGLFRTPLSDRSKRDLSKITDDGKIPHYFLALLLAPIRIRVKKLGDRTLSVSLRSNTDSRLVELTSNLSCGGALTEVQERPSDSLVELKARYDHLKKVLPKLTQQQLDELSANEKGDFAYINRSTGEPVFLEGTSRSRHAVVDKAYDAFVKANGKDPDNLSVADGKDLLLRFVKEKLLGPSAEFELFTELGFYRVLGDPVGDEVDKENPGLKKQLPYIRNILKNVQKVIAQDLQIPDAYWNYPDTPNTQLKQIGDDIEKVFKAEK